MLGVDARRAVIWKPPSAEFVAVPWIGRRAKSAGARGREAAAKPLPLQLRGAAADSWAQRAANLSGCATTARRAATHPAPPDLPQDRPGPAARRSTGAHLQVGYERSEEAAAGAGAWSWGAAERRGVCVSTPPGSALRPNSFRARETSCPVAASSPSATQPPADQCEQ